MTKSAIELSWTAKNGIMSSFPDPPTPLTSCHHLSYFGWHPPPSRVMTSFMNSPKVFRLPCLLYFHYKSGSFASQDQQKTHRDEFVISNFVNCRRQASAVPLDFQNLVTSICQSFLKTILFGDTLQWNCAVSYAPNKRQKCTHRPTTKQQMRSQS